MTHQERLRLIYLPFPVVRRLPTSYPHGGTIVNDGFGATLATKVRGHGGAFESDERHSTAVEDAAL